MHAYTNNSPRIVLQLWNAVLSPSPPMQINLFNLQDSIYRDITVCLDYSEQALPAGPQDSFQHTQHYLQHLTANKAPIQLYILPLP